MNQGSKAPASFAKKLVRDLRVDDTVIEDFECFVELLSKWQTAKNLVSRETLSEVWDRHILDSSVLSRLVERPAVWIDLGSGAGFPGLVTAILQKRFDEPGHVHLVEANTRKAAFLRTVIRECGLSASVHNSRIESLPKPPDLTADFLSARALAPLDELFSYASPYSQNGTVCFFHKGREIDGEI
ncbi:MAG: 16S rRNA (guanine(527)-N(7))-methyltransferase RsmG, partial [Pseudomonadota bacterium]